jgi:hypothetical protein
MYFTRQQLAELADGYAAVDGKCRNLYERYLARTYATDRGKEFGQQGFVRRIQALQRCITNVFNLLPPEVDAAPDDNTRHDAELQIQAFVLHVFGAADNLAWIWVSEKGIAKEDGAPLADGSIGIRKRQVLNSFTKEFRDHLKTLDAWFGCLEDFRHALAHRIPLYIPPYVVTRANEAAYRELEAKIAEAGRRMDFERRARHMTEQRLLTAFQPLMQHSYIEEARPLVFHPQMLADFNTIDELGRLMLAELAR